MTDSTDAGALREGRATDIARELGLTRMAISKLVRREDFPAPLRVSAAPKYRTGVYDLDAVGNWYRTVYNPRGLHRVRRSPRERPSTDESAASQED